MAYTIEQQNYINSQREESGQAPFVFDAEGNKVESNDNPPADPPVETEEERIARETAEAEAKKNEITETEEEKAAREEAEAKAATEKPVEAPEVDDAAVLAYLKKKGLAADSLADIAVKGKTQEQLAAEKKQREADKIAYGLQKGKFGTEDFEAYIADSKDPKSVVFEDYKKEQLALDPELTDEQIQEEFEATYNLNEASDSRLYKKGQKELALMADILIKQKHQKILSIDGEFSEHERTQREAAEQAAKIETQKPIYTKAVNDAFGSIKSFSIPVADDEIIEVELDESIIAPFRASMLEDSFAIEAIKSGFSKEGIADIAQTSIIKQNLNQIVKKACEKYHLNRVAGTRGVPVQAANGARRAGATQGKALTEAQLKAYELLGVEPPSQS
jgi:hypothetical protein